MNLKTIQKKLARIIVEHNRVIINIIIPLLLIGFFTLVSINSVKRQSNVTDEKFHLVRGIMLLETGDLRLNQHHPFLFNLIPALSTKFVNDVQIPSIQSDLWAKADKDNMSEELVAINGGREEFSTQILYPARVTMILITAILFIIIYFMIINIFGPIPAIITLAFLTTSPTVIAHSSLVTTDVPAMTTIFISTMAFYWAMKKFSKKLIPPKYIVLLAIITSIMLLSKYTGVFVTFMLIAGLFIHDLMVVAKTKSKLHIKIWNGIKSSLLIVFSILAIMTIAYKMQFATMSEMTYANEKKIEADLDNIRNIQESNPILGDSFERFYLEVPVPFPQFFLGFYSNVFKHNYYGHSSYFMGEFGGGGWPLYFPTSFILKESLGTLIALVGGIILAAIYIYKERPKLHIESLVLIGVPLVLAILSMMSSINLGIRHLLPIYPFIFLFLGIIFSKFINRKNLLASVCIIGILILINVLTIINTHPYYIPYFNQLAGGSSNGYKYVRDSNTDWGQSYIYVLDYIDANEDKNISMDPDDLNSAKYVIVKKDKLYGRKDKMSDSLKMINEEIDKGRATIVDEIAFTHVVIKLP